MSLPAQFAWLAEEKGPLAIVEAVKHVGTLEGSGSHDNPIIIGWADTIAKLFPGGYDDWAASFYGQDSIAWCGLFHAYCQAMAGRHPVDKYLSALEWRDFGHGVVSPMLGDTMVKTRAGGGHVTFYVGEDADHYYCLGGNQSDAVTIARYAKNLPWTFRRPDYHTQPQEVRVVRVNATGIAAAGSEA